VMYIQYVYYLCLKNILDVFDFKWKKNYQILIIFGASIPDATGYQTTV